MREAKYDEQDRWRVEDDDDEDYDYDHNELRGHRFALAAALGFGGRDGGTGTGRLLGAVGGHRARQVLPKESIRWSNDSRGAHCSVSIRALRQWVSRCLSRFGVLGVSVLGNACFDASCVSMVLA